MRDLWMKLPKWAKIAIPSVVVLIVIGAIADQESTSSDKSSADKPAAAKTSKPKPKFDGKAYAADAEKYFVESLGGREISSMCDSAYTHWACFYKGVSSPYKDALRIKLTTDGGWSKGELKDMAADAGKHWFNFMSMNDTYKSVSIMIVNINGIDHNVYK